ncbi:hypothetical protein ABK040_006595 [Willaertia magna]
MPPRKKATGTKATTKKKNDSTKRKRKEESESEPEVDISDGEDVEFIEYDEGSHKNKKVEEIYQKKSQLEHILLRPDSYVGSTQIHEDEQWVWDSDLQGMKFQNIKYVPALYKIFDEILVNAADHSVRDETVDKIKVTIDPEKNEISVLNSGAGIPVKMHNEHNVYVPTLIFGHLLTGSNFDDNQKKITGGRNGYGAKLTNIFSKQFIVETVDSEEKKKFRQVWTDNMGKAEEPKITNCSKESYTQITFSPDLERFNMKELDKDIVALMSKRVYDIAGTVRKGVGVWLNGKKITGIKTFKDYVKLYTAEKDILYFDDEKRWKVAVCLSEGTLQQVSFVNSICTTKGGKHVDHVVKQISDYLKKALQKKNKELKPAYIKNQLWVFVSSLIINPAFDSQTKDTLTTSLKDFGSKCKLEEDFLKKVNKMASEAVLKYAEFKAGKALSKKSGTKKTRLTGVSKLDDANDAGGKHSDKCTLILTEGDSAKALAVGGLSVVGRDYYGVFPLKGIPLNVRDCKLERVKKNEEICTLVKILGLKFGKDYTKEDIKSLRYGSVMIMADQDHDGSHIKGLLINFIHKFWPGLLKVPGFLKEFITPIVKATNKRTKQVKTFFTIPEYSAWRDSLTDSKGWQIKYYKGLGTSTPAEAKDYFSNMSVHQKRFKYVTDCDDKILTAFSKDRVDKRKEWLTNHTEGTYLDHSAKDISYADFIDKELVLFSKYDNIRSIPSLADGLKPGQRKILFSCFKRNLKREIKVAQLSGYVSEQSAYHHGEDSLNGTIINMAQNFVGSNNVNLLYPSGMFGTRLQGGKDSASPRYIFTKLSDITRYIFPKEDDAILDYLDDDGQSIEPKFYMPILPMVLVNGAEGIGTAWSTKIETYNPIDIVENLKRLLKGEEVIDMHPWFKGFDGSIEYLGTGKWRTKGVIEKIDSNNIEISELPVKVWTQPYKEFLEGLLEKNLIDDFRENHTDVTVSFSVKMTDSQMAAAEEKDIYEYFKLTKKFSTTNMVLFNEQGVLKEYETVQDILKEFYEVRLKYYHKRKEHMLGKLERDLEILRNKVRFIMEVINETLQVRKRKKADLLKELKSKKYTPFPKEKKKVVAVGDLNETGTEEEEEEEEENDKDVEDLSNGYNYLLSMPLWSLTLEKVKKLEKERDNKEQEVEVLRNTKVETIWEKELDKFVEQLAKTEEKEEKEIDAYIKKIEKQRGKNGKIARSKGYRANSTLRPEIVVVETKAKATTRKKKATTTTIKSGAKKKPATKKEESDDDAEEMKIESEDEKPKRGRPKKTDTKKTTTTKKTVKKEKKEEKEDEDSDKEDNDDYLPLAERLKKSSSKPAPKKETEIKEEQEEEVEETKIKARNNNKKKRKVSITDYFAPVVKNEEETKKATNKEKEEKEEEEDEELLLLDEDDDEEEETKPRSRLKRGGASKAKSKSKKVDSDDEEIVSLSSDEEEEYKGELDDSYVPDDEGDEE